MKAGKFIKISIIKLYFLSTCFSIAWTLYSGAWCPYQIEKIVPCRTRNGTEPYYGPNICWRNDNGSYACTKKILYRPRYVTTYKKILETKYKCCPGRSGIDCENECFNCSTYKKLEERVAATERRLSRLEYPKSTTERSDRHLRDHMSQNNVYGPISKDVNPEAPSALVSATLNLRLQKLLDEFRDLQNRIRLIENEMSRLNTQVDDLTLSNNNIGSNTFGRDSNNGKDIIMGNNKDIPDTPKSFTNNEADRDHHQKSVIISSSSSSSVSSSTISSTSHHHNHNHHDRHPVKADSIFRVLEENLERGDIASTLNDDYGDEIYNDNSTEQYIDQLQLKREISSP